MERRGAEAGPREGPGVPGLLDHHAGSFVDSYAATDPFEDFAESFGIWCALGPGSPLIPQAIEGNPSNGHVKIDWFEHSSSGINGSTRDSCTRLRALTR